MFADIKQWEGCQTVMHSFIPGSLSDEIVFLLSIIQSEMKPYHFVYGARQTWMTSHDMFVDGETFNKTCLFYSCLISFGFSAFSSVVYWHCRLNHERLDWLNWRWLWSAIIICFAWLFSLRLIKFLPSLHSFLVFIIVFSSSCFVPPCSSSWLS